MSTQKRDDILAAALRLVSTHGFTGTSMAMIAAEASTGAGTIYNYFTSKDELMDDLFRSLKTEFIEAIQKDVASKTSFRIQFLTMWKNVIQYALAHPEKVTYLQQYHHSPYFNENSAVFVEEIFTPLIGQIKNAIAAGEIRDFPIPVYETLTIDVAFSLAQRHGRGEIVLTDEVMRQMALACWHAIQA